MSDRCVGGAVPRFPLLAPPSIGSSHPCDTARSADRIAQRRTGCAATEAFWKARPLSPARMSSQRHFDQRGHERCPCCEVDSTLDHRGHMCPRLLCGAGEVALPQFEAEAKGVEGGKVHRDGDLTNLARVFERRAVRDEHTIAHASVSQCDRQLESDNRQPHHPRADRLMKASVVASPGQQ
eukprot:6204517-Prymnesium_polylepis.3